MLLSCHTHLESFKLYWPYSCDKAIWINWPLHVARCSCTKLGSLQKLRKLSGTSLWNFTLICSGSEFVVFRGGRVRPRLSSSAKLHPSESSRSREQDLAPNRRASSPQRCSMLTGARNDRWNSIIHKLKTYTYRCCEIQAGLTVGVVKSKQIQDKT